MFIFVVKLDIKFFYKFLYFRQVNTQIVNMLIFFKPIAFFIALMVQVEFTNTFAHVVRPDKFTSSFVVYASNDQIIAPNGSSVTGDPDGKAIFTLNINVDKDILCYNITTFNIKPNYKSPAKTATHIHEEKRGLTGPPRIALVNPFIEISENVRSCEECIKGPFYTGINTTTGIDTGSSSGFKLQQIQDHPTDFAVDIHTEDFISGAVRGTIENASNQPPCGEHDLVCSVMDPERKEFPWMNTLKAFDQCYNPETHVCVKPPNSSAMFLCHTTTPSICGRSCYDPSKYCCNIDSNWLLSSLQSL